MDALWSPSFHWLIFVLRGTVVYLAVLLLIRLAGKRQVGQMGTGEFVAILLISNAVQNSMNGGDNSITGGLILAAVITVLSVAVAFLTYKSRHAEAVLQGRPTLLIHKGKVLTANLEKEWMSMNELRAMLRHQGAGTTEEVEEAVLESSGQVSIIKKSEIAQSKR